MRLDRPTDEEPMLPGEFSVHVNARAEGGSAVTIYGDFDLATAPRVREALDRAIEAGGEVLVDLRACGFIDSTGIGVLVSAMVRLEEEGRVIRFRGAKERVRHTFDIAGVTSRDSVVFEDRAA
jgi:anti-sigma B factor antagonist